MNVVIVAPEPGRFCKEKDNIEAKYAGEGHKCFFIFRKAGDARNIMGNIRSFEPDLLITEDLEGFEMCTLTDAVSYNLIHCRQKHFLFSEHPANERYLSKQLSLVMTFVCPDEQKTDEIRTKYPDLPEVITEEIPFI